MKTYFGFINVGAAVALLAVALLTAWIVFKLFSGGSREPFDVAAPVRPLLRTVRRRMESFQDTWHPKHALRWIRKQVDF